MKISQLIAHLQTLDPDMPVLRRHPDGTQLSDLYPESFEEAVARTLDHAPGMWIDVSKRARGTDVSVITI